MAKKRISFKGVDKEIKRGGGGGKRIPEGDYAVKILNSEWFPDEDDPTGIRWECQVVRGEHKGVKLRGFTSLKSNALWSLRNLIHAATGKNVAGKALDFDPEKLYGKIVGAAVEDNEYEKGDKKKITSQINTFFPEDEINASEDDEDEDDEDEDESEDEESDDDDEELEDVDVEEL